jgi:hypothetical protein
LIISCRESKKKEKEGKKEGRKEEIKKKDVQSFIWAGAF